MKQIQVQSFGGPEQLELASVPIPEPRTGEVLIDVAVAGVLGIDAVIRSGRGGGQFAVELPWAPGMGVAGTISAVGAGLDDDLVGGRVVAQVSRGGYAQSAVAEIDDVLALPPEVSLLDAMAVLHDGRTALGLLSINPAASGQQVLIAPAAGGLGSNLVQLTAAAGAQVIALARGAGKLAVLRDLGATITIDQSDPDWSDHIRRAAPTGVDLVFDGLGGPIAAALVDLVANGGRYSNYGFAAGGPADVAALGGLRGVQVTGMEQLETLQEDRRALGTAAVTAVAEGRLRPLIGAVLPLTAARRAHEMLQDHQTVGKTLLVP